MLRLSERISKARTYLPALFGSVALVGQTAFGQVPVGSSQAPFATQGSLLGADPSGQPPQSSQTPQSPPGWDYARQAAPTLPNDPTLNAGAPAQPSAPPPFSATGGAFGPGSLTLAGGASTVAVADNAAYIDSAITRSRIRVRYDTAYNLNSPDRAEFFYPKCGCFGNPVNFPAFQGLGQGVAGTRVLSEAASQGYDPRARGPQHPGVVTGRAVDRYAGDPRIDYQELSTYLEYAPLRNFSVFADVPVRFLNPALVSNYKGFSDVNVGFKYAFVAEPDRFYTFQTRLYTPTGAPGRGLGTGHVSVEPALLIFQRLSDRLYLSGEFRDWVPIGGSNFAGNVLRYGVGLAYNIVLTDTFRMAPVNEIVGWTVLNGKYLTPNPTPDGTGIKSAAGVTIINEKIGVRFGIGDYSQSGGGSALNDRHSIFAGYARAITGDHWYQDALRVEYNLWF